MAPKSPRNQSPSTRGGPSNAPPRRRHRFPRVPDSNIVPKPSPPQQQQDPRTFELSQLRQSFKPTESADGTQFTLSLKPSDPDFVYAINALKLRLTVPLSYRQDRAVSIEVLNSEIPVGYRVNVERGFRELVEGRPTATLLELMKALDRGLEHMLSGEKAETVKIVPNFAPPPAPTSTPTPTPPATVAAQAPARALAGPVVSSEQRAAAKARRERETKQLESRLQLSDIFSKSEDGIEYVVPLEPRRKDLLPVPLQPLRSVRLIVPLGYDVQPPRIEFAGVPEDIKVRIQRRFGEFVEDNRSAPLTALLNILAVRLYTWAAEENEKALELKRRQKKIQEERRELAGIEAAKSGAEKQGQVEPGEKSDELFETSVLGKSHIKVIPRPPEWTLVGEDDSDDEDDTDLKESSGEDEAFNDHAAATMDDVPHAAQERGTSLSCPGIHMSGIELLEALTLNVTIKCSRCKTERETLNLHGTPPGTTPKPQAFLCDKCSATLGIGFRKDFIHQNSHRLGFFDLEGCTVSEILPSSFTPQCICSSPLPAPGMRDIIHGQSVSANCRECHRKMSLYIPEFKLLRITQGDNLNLEQIPLKKKVREPYVVGTELPHKGRCKHYRKSTRWFRFSCCSRVFPCDKCHDETEKSHKSEHANRMICGICSREQNYRPEDCRFCGNAFFAKKLSHYWEGGKGTRDQRLMSRNDPRKYKRLGKRPEE